MKNMPISICMVTYNDGAYLEPCLQKLRLLECEIVIVDMGSTDETIRIGRQYADQFGCCDEIQKGKLPQNQLSHKQPCDNLPPTILDEAGARNAAVLMASNPWILWMYATETISRWEGEKLISEFMGQEPLLGKIAVTEITGSLAAKQIAFRKETRIYHRAYHRFQGAAYPKLARVKKESRQTGKTRTQTMPVEIIQKSFLRSNEQSQQIGAMHLAGIEEKIRTHSNTLKDLSDQELSSHGTSSRKALLREMGMLLYAEGCIYHKLENWQQSMNSYEQALIYEEALQNQTVSQLVQNLGVVYCKAHQEKNAVMLMEQFAPILLKRQKKQQLPQTYLLTQGRVYLDSGNMTRARACYEEAIAMGNYEKRGNQILEAFQKLGAIYQTLHLQTDVEKCVWEQIRLKKKYDLLIKKYS